MDPARSAGYCTSVQFVKGGILESGWPDGQRAGASPSRRAAGSATRVASAIRRNRAIRAPHVVGRALAHRHARGRKASVAPVKVTNGGLRGGDRYRGPIVQSMAAVPTRRRNQDVGQRPEAVRRFGPFPRRGGGRDTVRGVVANPAGRASLGGDRARGRAVECAGNATPGPGRAGCMKWRGTGPDRRRVPAICQAR